MSPRLGAHMSVAGGLPRAVARAVLHDCQALQVFTKNASQWRGRPLPPAEIADFRDSVQRAGLESVLAHASYLINLASASPELHRQSVDAMADEIDRAEALGLLGVVLHPGCYTRGDAEEGLALIADALLDLLRARPDGKTMVLLEHTAGQGTALGARFEEIGSILARAGHHPRLGVCLDTCHLLASGYDLCSEEGYADTFDQFDRHIGFEHLRAFHLNDSKKPLGSRVDRHEHIGHGHLGLEPFRRIVNDARFRDLPMVLETPKTERKSAGPIQLDEMDASNLATLRALTHAVLHV